MYFSECIYVEWVYVFFCGYMYGISGCIFLSVCVLNECMYFSACICMGEVYVIFLSVCVYMFR